MWHMAAFVQHMRRCVDLTEAPKYWPPSLSDIVMEVSAQEPQVRSYAEAAMLCPGLHAPPQQQAVTCAGCCSMFVN